MINHVITRCVPQGRKIAKQHNGWGMIGEHLLFTNLFLEDVDIVQKFENFANTQFM